MNNNLSRREEYVPKNIRIRSGGSNLLRNTADTIAQWATPVRTLNHVESMPSKTLFANQLLASQPGSALVDLLPHLQRITLPGDDYIYQPGDDVDYIYFPETAVFSEFQILEDGRTVEIAMTGKEGVAGLSAVFSPHPMMNWTQTSIGGTALKISAQKLKEEFSRSRAFQMMLLDYVGSYIGQISQRVICNSYHTVEKRLCCWLLMLQDRCEGSKLSVTQEQMARFLGVHRPSITQIALLLRQRGIINYMRGKIFILNRRELENAACECYQVTHRSSTGSYAF
jgi:CRP-like cAMP-binding protein